MIAWDPALGRYVERTNGLYPAYFRTEAIPFYARLLHDPDDPPKMTWYGLAEARGCGCQALAAMATGLRQNQAAYPPNSAFEALRREALQLEAQTSHRRAQ